MPAPDIHAGLPYPLTRLNPWFPGQYGVPYTDHDTGLRTDPVGTVFYVDPNHIDPNDSRDGTDPNAPLRTIQTAVTRCESYHNDVIHVGPNNANGTVHALPITENVTLNKGGVRLVASTMGATGVYWGGSGIGLTVTAPDCIVEGFHFYFFDTGIQLLYDNVQSAWAYNCTLRHNYFGFCDIGVHLTDSHYGLVHGCWFDSCTFGLYADSGNNESPWDFQVHDNFFDVCLYAMSLPDAHFFNIYGNRIMSVGGAPGGTNEGINLTGGRANIVSQNVLPCTLPVPGPGDYNDVNTAGIGDLWAHNYLMDGVSVTNPT